ncbi:MAG: flotillin-like FloA family protein [Bacteroidales bacterium]|nr:flotillin-like FloA family protein [Bacteroidales bacterium]
MILEADETFEIEQMLTAYKTCKKKTQLDLIESDETLDPAKKRELLAFFNKKTEVENLKSLGILKDDDTSTSGKDKSKSKSNKVKESDFNKKKDELQALKTENVLEFLKKYELVSSMGKMDALEPFARAWVDQKNAFLGIDLDTAMTFISKGRDFSLFVNLDILAKRADIELDEKNLINFVDDEGLKIIIHSLIRAKYEGVYMSETESLSINKANVVEYADSFKVTVDLLKTLYGMKRDVKRFTDVMIRAHNAGVNINFSMMDLYSMTDDQFDILVTNIIKASNKGISIDQNDLIRQNIRSNDVTQLVKALIKANEYKLDLTPDELMSYIASTHSDVVKFVKAYHYALAHNLPSEDGTPLSKDHLVEYSRPEADLFDYVQGLQFAIEAKEDCIKNFEENKQKARENGMPESEIAELKPEDFDGGINYKNLKKHFIKFGSVKNVIETVQIANAKGLELPFELATRICESPDWDLKDAIMWAQKPFILTVVPEFTCLSKEGVQITPKISATVRGKMPLILDGYDDRVLFLRINEAAIMELESAKNLDEILQTLPDISHRVLHRVNEEQERQEIKTGRVKESELNNVCRYDLLDINIYDIVVGQNVKSELNRRKAENDAEIRRLQAEADRAKAEADLRRAMVEQYEKGIKPNFNELHKANLLADKGENITTGYEKPVE